MMPSCESCRFYRPGGPYAQCVSLDAWGNQLPGGPATFCVVERAYPFFGCGPRARYYKPVTPRWSLLRRFAEWLGVL